MVWILMKVRVLAACMHSHSHTHTQLTHTNTKTQKHTHTNAHANAHTNAHTHTNAHAKAHANAHTNAHPHKRTPTQTHTHTNAHGKGGQGLQRPAGATGGSGSTALHALRMLSTRRRKVTHAPACIPTRWRPTPHLAYTRTHNRMLLHAHTRI